MKFSLPQFYAVIEQLNCASGEHIEGVFLFISYMRLLFRDYALLSLRIVLVVRLLCVV